MSGHLLYGHRIRDRERVALPGAAPAIAARTQPRTTDEKAPRRSLPRPALLRFRSVPKRPRRPSRTLCPRIENPDRSRGFDQSALAAGTGFAVAAEDPIPHVPLKLLNLTLNHFAQSPVGARQGFAAPNSGILIVSVKVSKILTQSGNPFALFVEKLLHQRP